MELKELKEKYLASLNGTEKTKKSYNGRLDAFFLFLTAKRIQAIADLNEKLIKQYQDQLKVSTNTRYVYLDQLKKFLKYLYQENYSFIDLSGCIQLPSWERKKRKQLSLKQAEKRIARIKEPEPYQSRNKAILALHLLEELKSGDIYNLTVLDLDLPTNELRLKRKKTFRKLNPETVGYLKKYLRNRNLFKPKQDYLFLNPTGKQLGQQAISIILRKAKK